MLVIGATMFVSSCSDDNDGGGSAPQGPTATFDGDLLTRTGDFIFSYDSKGRCVSVKDVYYSDEEMYTIDYESGKMTMEEDDFPYNVSFTRDGYISRVWLNESVKEDGVTYKIEGNITLSYDSYGHLVSGTSTGKMSASGYGEPYEEKDNVEAKYTWRNGNLTNVQLKESSYDTEDGNYRSTTTVEIEYSDTPNEFNQWTWAQEEVMNAADLLGFVGLTGRGTANLISSYTETTKEEGEYDSEDSHTYSASYTINDNGSIGRERLNGSYYNYTYSSFVDDTPRSASATAMPKHAGTSLIMKLHRDIQKYRAKLNTQK